MISITERKDAVSHEMKDGYDWDVHTLVPSLAQVNIEGTIGDDDEVHT